MMVAETRLTDEMTVQANLAVGTLLATENRLVEITARQNEDYVCSQVMHYCAVGWPSHRSLQSVIGSYWPVQNELTIENGLLLDGARHVVPTYIQLAMLDRLREGHHDVVGC